MCNEKKTFFDWQWDSGGTLAQLTPYNGSAMYINYVF